MKPEENKPKRQKFKTYPMGYFHIDIAQLHTREGKLYMFVAIDRTSKLALVELVTSADKMQAAAFLNRLIETVPYKIHTILDDNGVQFTNRKKDKLAFKHIFTRTCQNHSIDHRLTQINHPWTNGQVERMNRTIKEATVKSFHYDNHQQLETHLQTFIDAYNFARRLKTLKGLTPHEFICKSYQNETQLFKENPCHKLAGLYRQSLLVSALRPVQRRALRVGIQQDDVLTAQRQFSGNVCGKRGFADTAFLVEQGDNHGNVLHVVKPARPCRPLVMHRRDVFLLQKLEIELGKLKGRKTQYQQGVMEVSHA